MLEVGRAGQAWIFRHSYGASSCCPEGYGSLGALDTNPPRKRGTEPIIQPASSRVRSFQTG